jgi:hypothetical protein
MENSVQAYKMTFFEYYKMILEKVSSYPVIFKKELRKALRNLGKNDASKLIDWCRERTGKIKKVRKSKK